MTDSRAAKVVATRVSRAIDASGHSLESIASAADLTTSELTARLNGAREFTIRQLVQVGGFLHSDPASFLIGAK